MKQSKFYQIKNITEREYTLVDCDGSVITRQIQDVDKSASAFTIRDAKTGDMLYSPCCKLLWIYKDGNSCYIGNNLNYNENCVVVNSPICIPTDVVPATKEQRNILFQKMKEAGYEWDVEKKELKKIEQKPVEWSEKYIANVFEKVGLAKVVRELGNDELTDALQSAMIELAETNPPVEWSEEDEEKLSSLLHTLHSIENYKFDTWLILLNDRIKFPTNPEWRDEDEEKRKRIMHRLSLDETINNKDLADINDWLKSLKTLGSRVTNK